MRALPLPSDPTFTAVAYHGSVVLAAVLTDSLLSPLTPKDPHPHPSEPSPSSPAEPHKRKPRMSTALSRGVVSGVGLAVGVVVGGLLVKERALPGAAAKGAFFGVFASFCEQMVKYAM